MLDRLQNRLFLNSVGILLGAAIAAAAIASPAWSEERTAGEKVGVEDVIEQAEQSVPSIAAHHNEALEEAVEAEIKEDIGFPQLKTETYASQVFWLFVSFSLMYLLMSRLALPRVGEVLESRREQKESNLKRAEQLQEEAEKAKESYEEALAKAQESAQEAITAAEQNIAEKMAAESARFAEHARKRVVAAEQGIEKARADALGSLADISAEISAEIVNKVAGVKITKADAKKVVTTVMKKEAA